MKILVKILALGTLLAGSAPFALANTIITFTGNGNFVNAGGAAGDVWATLDTGFMFTNIVATQSLGAGVAAGASVSGTTPKPFFYSHIAPDTPPGAPLWSAGGGGKTYQFDVTSDTPLPAPGSNTFYLTGNYIVSMGATTLSSTREVFQVTVSTKPNTGSTFDFTAVLVPAPEPGGLALLGTGLLGAVGIARRRIFS